MQLQRFESTGHFRATPPPRKRRPTPSKWKLSTLDGPTTTESRRPSANPETAILEGFAFSLRTEYPALNHSKPVYEMKKILHDRFIVCEVHFTDPVPVSVDGRLRDQACPTDLGAIGGLEADHVGGTVGGVTGISPGVSPT